jgi:hypothetical protein
MKVWTGKNGTQRVYLQDFFKDRDAVKETYHISFQDQRWFADRCYYDVETDSVTGVDDKYFRYFGSFRADMREMAREFLGLVDTEETEGPETETTETAETAETTETARMTVTGLREERQSLGEYLAGLHKAWGTLDGPHYATNVYDEDEDADAFGVCEY